MNKVNKELEKLKTQILFNEIHATERSDEFEELCNQADFMVRHKIEIGGTDPPYILFLKLAGGVIRRELLIDLCHDLKRHTDWKTLAHLYNEGDDTYYEDFFKREIEKAKTIMKKLRPFFLEYTQTWTPERKAMDLAKPEGRFLKGWYIEGMTKNKIKIK